MINEPRSKPFDWLTGATSFYPNRDVQVKGVIHLERIKWEYKVLPYKDLISESNDYDVEDILNNLGENGWELAVSISQVIAKTNRSYENNNHDEKSVTSNVFTFKREKE